jgi:hypothetical protein
MLPVWLSGCALLFLSLACLYDKAESRVSALSGDQVVRNYKLVLLGEAGVGKSCIAHRFVRGSFSDGLEATNGGEPKALPHRAH